MGGLLLISLKTFQHLNLALTLLALLGISLLSRWSPWPQCRVCLQVSCVMFSVAVMAMFVFGLPSLMPLPQRLMHGAIQIVFDMLLGLACAWLLRALIYYRRRKAGYHI